MLKKAEFATFASSDLLYLLNPLSPKNWLKNLKWLFLQTKFPLHSDVSTAAFGQGLPPDAADAELSDPRFSPYRRD